MVTTGILLFDDVEELDFAGPWEVLTSARKDGDVVVTVAEHDRPVQAAKGLRVVPDHTFDTCPDLDVVLVPGGQGTRREDDDVLVAWLTKAAAEATWVTSVCTGSFLLWKAGVARGRTVTTHWAFVDALRSKGDITVVDDQRFVVDDHLVSAAGVSAGIDMAFWLVGELYGEDHARDVQHFIEYYPEPPFTGRR
ncbi:MAG: ThiJ/PfpI family protein [Actinomycetia bacterium]|nr:ThiJ/PfpI family protein [Actinomycetes bacterium]